MATKPGERRLQILQTLAQMLETPKGEKITTAALAAKLECSEAALYRHFASKAQMFDGLIEFIEQSLFGVINQITSEETQGLKQVELILGLLLRFAQKNRGMTRVLIGDALSNENERLQARINTLLDKIEAALKQALRIAATQESLKPDADFGALANLLRCYVVGRWDQYTRSGFVREPLAQWLQQWSMLYFACLSQAGIPACSAMSRKYLGERFDIHGGGMDLVPTHHSNEIAQSMACCKTTPANYWMHTNMLTVNGTRMSKSLGNGFLPEELFTGNHPLLEKAYPPIVVRFFMLQTHYRSTLDFSNEALQASEKGLKRLWDAYEVLKKLAVGNGQQASDAELDAKVNKLLNELDEFMHDDFNTAKVLGNMFELEPVINSIKDGLIKRQHRDAPPEPLEFRRARRPAHRDDLVAAVERVLDHVLPQLPGGADDADPPR